MSEVAPPPAPRPRRWPLYVSLFLNVVLLTAIAVGGWRMHDRWEQVRQWREERMAGPGEPGFGMGAWMPRQIERMLPRDAREKVKAIREAHAGEFRPLFDNARTARDTIKAAFDAEPFDSSALTSALAALRTADQAIAELSAKVIVEIASVLTPEERKQVREAFREKMEKMKDRRKGPRGPDGEARPDGPPPGEGEGMGPPPPPDEPPPPPPGP